jgi:DNA repair protein RecN (Recombination protein N)
VNGRAATLAELADVTAALMELHGQSTHQALRTVAAQREALDVFAGVDLEPRRVARRALAATEEALSSLGGDGRSRAREMALLGHEIAEIDDAELHDPHEAAILEREEDALARAEEARQAALAAAQMLRGDGGVLEQLATTRAALADLPEPLPDLAAGISSAAADLDDLATSLRGAGEGFESHPDRLEAVRARRRLIADLCRRYGDDIAAVVAHADRSRERLTELESHDQRAGALEQDLAAAQRALTEVEAALAETRRSAAPRLAAAVQDRMAELALPHARLECEVHGPAGDHVELLLAANPGEPPRPLTKVASGGELSRTMLALRLVLAGGPATLVFDEVDAGLGGETGLAVGRALAGVARDHQVLVITHLPQVAAHADHQVVVSKEVERGRTRTLAAAVDGADRVAELARMLAGRPDSDSGRRHAAELLDAAGA